MNITVVGGGYVGLVTGACLASVGHRVTCADVREDVVRVVNAGDVPFFEPGLASILATERRSGRFEATTDPAAAVRSSELSMIAVGTPSTPAGIDLTAVRAAAGAIGRALAGTGRYHVVVVKSTVVPGTTDTDVARAFEEASGRHAGEYGLCMNPEFLREGSAVDDFMHPDRIVIGQADQRAGDVVASLYDPFSCPIVRVGLREAELIKYASNALLALLISFSNELAAICEGMPGADIETVMDGLHLDRRLSPVAGGTRVTPEILSYLRAGIGFGGSCLPKDVTALRAFARAHDVAMPLVDAVLAVNDRRPGLLAARLEAILGTLEGKTVAVLGLAFKPGTDDVRNSPALAVVDELVARGARARAYDPIVQQALRTPGGHELDVRATREAALEGADAAVITVADPALRTWEWPVLGALMRDPVLLDGRNVLWRSPPAGVRYYGIGRHLDAESGLRPATGRPETT